MASKFAIWALLFLTVGTLFLSHIQMARAETADDDDDAAAHADDLEVGEEADADDDETDDFDDEDEDGERSTAITSHPDITTHVVFPDNTDKKFVVGQKATALVVFTNRAKKAFNITAVGAALHSPFDFSYHIQNFTAREMDAPVHPGHQISVEYAFMPDPSLEPLEFWLSAWLQYNSSEPEPITYRTTFFNGTVELTEKPSEFDAKSFFTYVIGIAVVAVGGFFVYDSLAKPSRKSRVERGTRSESNGNLSGSSGSSDGGWGQAYVPREKAGRVPSRGGSSKKASGPAAKKGSN